MVKFLKSTNRDCWDDTFITEKEYDPNKEYYCEYCGKLESNSWHAGYDDDDIVFCSLYCSSEYYASRCNSSKTIDGNIIYSKSSLLLSLYEFVENVQYRSEDPREGNLCSALLYAMEDEKLVIFGNNKHIKDR